MVTETPCSPRCPRRARPIWLALAVAIGLAGCTDEAERAAPATFTVGLITNNPNGLRNLAGFRAGLTARGYVEGENTRYIDAGKPVRPGELVSAIESMIDQGCMLIFTAGTPTGVAAAEATRERSVPVVFGVIADPVAAGVMTNLTRPGGNMTGVMLSPNQGRRLQLLRTVAPRAQRVLLPYSPDDAAPTSALAQIESVAPALGMELVHAPTPDDDDVTELLARFPADIDAVFMLPGSTVSRHVRELLEVANMRRLPVSGPSMAQAEAGALMAYGIVHHEVGIQAAHIADRVLRGALPGDIPVETAEFFLIINVAAAERIGLELPEEVLQQADLIVRKDSFSP